MKEHTTPVDAEPRVCECRRLAVVRTVIVVADGHKCPSCGGYTYRRPSTTETDEVTR